jgi:hypothetical protein
LAEEWLREAREDLRELERILKPEECGRHGQSEGDAPEVKPAWPLRPLKPLDPDYPLDPSNTDLYHFPLDMDIVKPLTYLVIELNF